MISWIYFNFGAYELTHMISPGIQNILYKIPLLSGFTTEQLDSLLRTVKSKRLKQGEILFSEGSRGTSLYIVLQGLLLTSVQHGTPFEKKICKLKPGDTFGEIAMLTGCERTATIRSLEESLVFEITKEAIQHAGLGAVFYQTLAHILAERLIKMNDKASNDINFADTFIGDQDDLLLDMNRITI